MKCPCKGHGQTFCRSRSLISLRFINGNFLPAGLSMKLKRTLQSQQNAAVSAQECRIYTELGLERLDESENYCKYNGIDCVEYYKLCSEYLN